MRGEKTPLIAAECCPEPGVIEDTVIPEVFASGVGRITLIGDGLFEAVLYRNSRTTPDDPIQKTAVCRILMPVNGLPNAIRLAMCAIAQSGSSLLAEVLQFSSH